MSPSNARSIDMVSRYRAGETLQSIGDEYGICRERVRQILKMCGLSRFDGGVTIRYFLNSRKHIEKQKQDRTRSDAFKRKKWGISLEEWRRIKGAFGYKPFSAYVTQRRNAKNRGIPWAFSFPEWWAIWQLSGRWNDRGRGNGYCMARFGDSGPYSKDNVYICTIGQNFSDSYITKPAFMRLLKRRNLVSKKK